MSHSLDVKSLGTRQGHQRIEAKPSRVFSTNQSYYPTPMHTVSLTLWKKNQTPTFHFIIRKLFSNPAKKTTWGGDNWRKLGGGTKTSSSIGQIATQQVVQKTRVVVYFIDWHVAAFFQTFKENTRTWQEVCRSGYKLQPAKSQILLVKQNPLETRIF